EGAGRHRADRRARHGGGGSPGKARPRSAPRPPARERRACRHPGRPGGPGGLRRRAEMTVTVGDPLLAFDGLAGGYGDTVVLRGVGGAVASGQVLGILGRNGVGKTTLLRLLMGYLATSAGSVRLRGR